jgi:hypothetical protein
LKHKRMYIDYLEDIAKAIEEIDLNTTSQTESAA